ncbi:peptidyl-tRNA hydrolase Pth2 [Dactylosporangium sp. AC04546]|uniref:peptidyl-tRNA hydrolase Pth2 n=1 Tax=Dactylosporangium sp. AC04546 TaxID=2862460 RepID=UPI001EDD5D46|nr:peptidyl-tRNA hydrolase Pth2 [Dactylosporangium sp. AC04546]WVK79779.1 peptidyl-tRNA hydrolase Pth2 [Dactylosporangium sp. AC04546]
MPTKLVLVVRTDLDMGKGKIAAQAAHAAVAAALGTLSTPGFRTWLREGQPKVVLRVSGEDALRQVCADAEAEGLPVQLIQDAGRTQVAAGTPTCCAVGPADVADVDRVTGTLSLL